MSILSGGYTPAYSCLSGPTPGAQALMAWHLGAYADVGAANLGIYNCKRIAGSTVWSLHAEGRAADLGTAPYRNHPWLDHEAEVLRLHSAELGIQCLIHARRIWSSSYPYAGWRPYDGESHDGHIHAELTWHAARNLTVSTINNVLSAHQQPEDDMQLSDPVDLFWDKDVQYSAKRTTVEGALASTNYYTIDVRNRVNRIEALLVAQQAVISTLAAAVTGADGNISAAQLKAVIDQALSEHLERLPDQVATATINQIAS